ncbi:MULTISPECIES: pirin family protein [unclassified Agarivorans]|uniref:pirin family protein n=1 Tax=unclassified Agarivorans TaxID=2636026 RepID=UPI0026E42036|nr:MULTISPECIES: pirin family protein [unclassified Agarivorans]MDO6688018.1 pirin family protein [Agarivorans sp. 3_MG-2023]MDO6715285.1 pirin family protein [Agarivorans sp. 2_MG-2023]MDO6763418.1 pirin family protein [Agarivorans sp. 1_MG-2023]
MKILSRDSLALGGFAGIVEHRLVTDSKVFGARKKPETFDGLGSMVYLADARYKPFGSSGMHPHRELDVISIIVEGRVSHEGSMEHGKNLVAGDVQVQRAGGEGFSHNELNPDNDTNRMLQVWALPEVEGQRASYKSYTPKLDGITRIYGGDSSQEKTFDSHTLIDIAHVTAGSDLHFQSNTLIYLISGDAQISEKANAEVLTVKEGDLIRSSELTISAINHLHLLVVSE